MRGCAHATQTIHVLAMEYAHVILIGHVVVNPTAPVILNTHVYVKEYAHVTMMKDITASAKLIKPLLLVQQM